MERKWYYLSAIIDAYKGFVSPYEVVSYRDIKLAPRVSKKAIDEYNLDVSILHTDRVSFYNSDNFMTSIKKKYRSINER